MDKICETVLAILVSGDGMGRDSATLVLVTGFPITLNDSTEQGRETNTFGFMNELLVGLLEEELEVSPGIEPELLMVVEV